MNIKQLRAELRAWGRYWASKEELQGYASTSVTERCCEVMRTGVWISSDKHLFSHQSDSILPPEWINSLSSKIDKLPPNYISVINSVYVRGFAAKGVLLRTLSYAEIALLGMIVE
ncbi:hypothetical protein EIK76_00350 [Rheinheimera mesophila]|uniref:Uncharacterized protein n=1 Tax=Rheinheimera mesophila TaxID=1547515 RepID=A0A3P3QMY6_9GAMM|nr:hypothetical protein [Rheinheimera mesophila]RRJ22571.1 hypothetical protein EIK76_00350 [Rheinheimera mesophila]